VVVAMVEDEKGPESGVGTKEGDEEKDAERCRILSSRALLPLPSLPFSLFLSFSSPFHLISSVLVLFSFLPLVAAPSLATAS